MIRTVAVGVTMTWAMLAAADGAHPLDPHLAAAARVGVDMIDVQGAGTTESTTWFVEPEVGVRLVSWLSVVAFGDYSSQSDTPAPIPTSQGAILYTYGSDVFDAGIRLRVHAYAAFLGVGGGHEWLRKTINARCVENCGPLSGSGPDNFDSSQWTDVTLLELHAGYTFRKLRAIRCGAIQALAAFAISRYDNGEHGALRVGIGVQY